MPPAEIRSPIDLVEARAYVATGPGLPPREPGALRPYVPSQWTAPEYRHGLAVGEYAFDPDESPDVGAVVDSLKHFLLDCDGIAMDDPLVLIADKLSPGMSTAMRERARARLTAYLRFLVAIRELVAEGVVVFVEPRLEIHNRTPMLVGWQEQKRLAATLTFDDLPDPAAPVLATIDGRLSELAVAGETLAMGLNACVVHGGAVDLHLAFRHSEALLEHVLAEAGGAVAVGLGEAERRRIEQGLTEQEILRRVLDLPVPTFHRMTPKAILDVRREDAFENLRAALRRAVRAAQLAVDWVRGGSRRAADRAFAEHALLFRPDPL